MKEDRATRGSRVKQAVANQRLEGLTVAEEARRIADNYVVGNASAREAAQKIRDRFGITDQ